ncbi:alpha/beta hydrolase [Acholeplasma hippikon]|uniref:Lipase 2 n=1 Tax=Acholeplasma hippikon TaxID=264636 RepID=A0A449BIR6_9MOLU|nr:alpha/beta hydrolase [Acholeplasma hippikon]VEU82332.1 Lipase 2 [Acholeplasma hippikon]
MKVNKGEVNRELALTGRLIQTFVPSFSQNKLPIARSLMNLIKGSCKVDLSYEQIYIKREDGTDLRVCIYKPNTMNEPLPVVVWMHGGGYGLGIPEQNEKFFKRMIDETNVVIVSPDYTLSFEKPYPAAINDCYLALKFTKDNASLLNIKPNQIMIGGESAGGGLTAALSIIARDKKEVNISFQMPLYPMLDDRMIFPSTIDNNDPVWDSKSNKEAWKVYLGDLFGTDDVPPYASPMREIDFSNLPPTLTYVGSLEVFKDETMDYVDKLLKSSNEVYFQLYEGCYHSFDMLNSNTVIANEAFTFLFTTLRYAIKNYFKEN